MNRALEAIVGCVTVGMGVELAITTGPEAAKRVAEAMSYAAETKNYWPVIKAALPFAGYTAVVGLGIEFIIKAAKGKNGHDFYEK